MHRGSLEWIQKNVRDLFVWCKPWFGDWERYTELQVQVTCKHTLWLAGCLPTDQDTSCTSTKVHTCSDLFMVQAVQGGHAHCGLVGVSYCSIARHISLWCKLDLQIKKTFMQLQVKVRYKALMHYCFMASLLRGHWLPGTFTWLVSFVYIYLEQPYKD